MSRTSWRCSRRARPSSIITTRSPRPIARRGSPKLPEVCSGACSKSAPTRCVIPRPCGVARSKNGWRIIGCSRKPASCAWRSWIPGRPTSGWPTTKVCPAPTDFIYAHSPREVRWWFDDVTELELGPMFSIFEPSFLRVPLAYERAGRLPRGSFVKLYFSGGGRADGRVGVRDAAVAGVPRCVSRDARRLERAVGRGGSRRRRHRERAGPSRARARRTSTRRARGLRRPRSTDQRRGRRPRRRAVCRRRASGRDARRSGAAARRPRTRSSVGAVA